MNYVLPKARFWNVSYTLVLYFAGRPNVTNLGLIAIVNFFQGLKTHLAAKKAKLLFSNWSIFFLLTLTKGVFGQVPKCTRPLIKVSAAQGEGKTTPRLAAAWKWWTPRTRWPRGQNAEDVILVIVRVVNSDDFAARDRAWWTVAERHHSVVKVNGGSTTLLLLRRRYTRANVGEPRLAMPSNSLQDHVGCRAFLYCVLWTGEILL